MKLNNKGFAISSIMYIILILAVILISVTLAILSSRKMILDKIKKETSDNIYGISYNSVINTLKHEAIRYASNNNIEKEDIKIGDFETSVSQELLDYHELSEKYLTLSKNNYSYDIYLGQTKKITNISKPIDNMLGIASYKIEGNSYQETRSGKNLIPYPYKNGSKTISGITYTVNSDGSIHISGTATANSAFGLYQEINSLPVGVNVGNKYTISLIYNKDIVNDVALYCNYYKVGSTTLGGYSNWMSVTRTYISKDLPEDIQGLYCYLMVLKDKTVEGTVYPQMEKGTTVTEYEQYVGGVSSPNPEYPSEIKNVGDKSKNLLKINPQRKLKSNFSECFYLPKGEYTLSMNFNDATSWRFIFTLYDVNGNLITEDSETATHLKSTKPIYYSSGNGGVYQNSDNITENYITFETDADYYIGINFYFGNTTSSTTVTRSQLELGTTVTTYEPYGYKIPITVRGKNLLKFNDKQEVTNTNYNGDLKSIDVNLPKGTKITASADVDATLTTTNNNTVSLKLTYEDNTTEIINYFNSTSIKVLGGAKGRAYTSYVAPKNVKKITITMHAFNKSNGGTTTFSNFQIALGDNNIYEPYIEPVTTNIYLEEPLRKIGDSDDFIEYKTQNIERNIYVDKISELRGLKYYEPSEAYPYGFIIAYTTRTRKYSVEMLSSIYKQSGFKDDKSAFGNSSASNIYFVDSNYTDVTIFQNELKDNEVHYILDSPNLQPSNLPNIQTSVGSSMIEIDTTIQPSSVEFTIIEKIRKL